MTIDKDACKRVLTGRGVDFYADFHSLPSAAVIELVNMARAVNYKPPANANGSTARYFFAYLNRK